MVVGVVCGLLHVCQTGSDGAVGGQGKLRRQWQPGMCYEFVYRWQASIERQWPSTRAVELQAIVVRDLDAMVLPKGGTACVSDLRVSVPGTSTFVLPLQQESDHVRLRFPKSPLALVPMLAGQIQEGAPASIRKGKARRSSWKLDLPDETTRSKFSSRRTLQMKQEESSVTRYPSFQGRIRTLLDHLHGLKIFNRC